MCWIFFFQAEDGIRDYKVTGVQTCALPISRPGPFLGATGSWDDPAQGVRCEAPRGIDLPPPPFGALPWPRKAEPIRFQNFRTPAINLCNDSVGGGIRDADLPRERSRSAGPTPDRDRRPPRPYRRRNRTPPNHVPRLRIPDLRRPIAGPRAG